MHPGLAISWEDCGYCTSQDTLRCQEVITEKMTGFPNLGSSKKTSSSLSQLPMLIPHCTLWGSCMVQCGKGLLSKQGCVETGKGNNQWKDTERPWKQLMLEAPSAIITELNSLSPFYRCRDRGLKRRNDLGSSCLSETNNYNRHRLQASL